MHQHTISLLLLISNYSHYYQTIVAAAFSIDIQKIQHVTKDNFHPNKHYYHNHHNNNVDDGRQRNTPCYYETPILIENAITEQQCDDICNKIVNELGNEYVTIQRKIKYDNEDDVETKLTDDTLNNAFDFLMESHHYDSYFCFLEGLLDDNKNLDNVRHVLHNARESLFDRNDDDTQQQHQTTDDLFQYFPKDVKPTDCVVLAGDGATSTLHRDPYTWTGTSLCLEGTKLWRFIAPPSLHSPTMGMDDDSQRVREIDDMLKSYRLPSVAWDDDVYLSAGWQSDFSLYASRCDDIPSAKDFAVLEDDVGGVEHLVKTHLEGIAFDVDKLTPSDEIVHWLSARRENSQSLYSVVQKPGDLLIIPAYWWHQTYALQPSLAIASQRGGLFTRDAKRVIEHIFDTVGVASDDDRKKGLPTILQKVLKGSYDADAGTPKDVVEALFQVLSSRG